MTRWKSMAKDMTKRDSGIVFDLLQVFRGSKAMFAAVYPISSGFQGR